MEDNKLEITKKTSAGEITASLWDDPNYPGITVFINGEQVAVVEYQVDTKKHVVHVWNEESDEPLASLDIQL